MTSYSEWDAMSHRERLLVIKRDYLEKGESLRVIAEKYGTYNQKVQRFIKKYGLPSRNKREAMINADKLGRLDHLKYRKPTESEKLKISKTQKKIWKDDKERKKMMAKIAEKRLQDMSYEERQQLQVSSMEGLRRSMLEGSKAEKYLRRGLTEAGYLVESHKKGLVPHIDPKMSVDIFLPELSIAIEVDGPAHFLSDIYGEEKLAKRQISDNRKNAALITSGIKVLRVKLTSHGKTLYEKHQLLEKVLQELQSFDEDYREIEVG